MKNVIGIFLMTYFTCLCADETGSDFFIYAERRQIALSDVKPVFSNLDEAVKFIADFQNQAKNMYGIRPNAIEAIEMAKQIVIDSQEFSSKERKQLVAAYDMLKEELTCKSANWAFGKKKTKKSVELELPPKLATGFMCILGGSLLCLVPGAQGVGVFFITSGAAIALEGFASGEVPFMVDIDTGEKFRTGTREKFLQCRTIR